VFAPANGHVHGNVERKAYLGVILHGVLKTLKLLAHSRTADYFGLAAQMHAKMGTGQLIGLYNRKLTLVIIDACLKYQGTLIEQTITEHS